MVTADHCEVAHNSADFDISQLSQAGQSLMDVFRSELRLGIVNSQFQKFGGKASNSRRKFRKNDFVLILLPSAMKIRYGLVVTQTSPHTVRCRICVKRNNKLDKTYLTCEADYTIQQITLLRKAEC